MVQKNNTITNIKKWKEFDNTPQQMNEETLKNSELRYRRLFETAQDAILILDGETGQITDANPFVQTLLGYSLNELAGKRLWEISPFKNIAENKQLFQKLQKETYVRYEHIPLQTKQKNVAPRNSRKTRKIRAIFNKKDSLQNSFFKSGLLFKDNNYSLKYH